MSRDSIRTEGVQPMKKEQDLTEETTAGQEPEEAAKAAESASQPEQAEQPEIKQTRTEPDPAEQLAAAHGCEIVTVLKLPYGTPDAADAGPDGAFRAAPVDLQVQLFKIHEAPG